MKKIITILVLILLVNGIPNLTVFAQRPRHRRPAYKSHTASEQNIELPVAIENAKIFESCVASDDTRPRIDTKWELNAALCGKAISKPIPRYPEEAKATKVSGVVAVSIAIDEQGRVFWANVINGPALLRDASKKAACRARYSPTLISGRTVRTSAVITYNYLPQ